MARVTTGTKKAAKVARMEGRTHGREAVARKEAKGKRKVAREKPERAGHVATCGKTGHIAAWCRKGGNKKLYAIDEDDSENIEESADNDADLQAWCLLEESENEQCQEVISRRDKAKGRRKPIKRHCWVWRTVTIRVQRKSLK